MKLWWSYLFSCNGHFIQMVSQTVILAMYLNAKNEERKTGLKPNTNNFHTQMYRVPVINNVYK